MNMLKVVNAARVCAGALLGSRLIRSSGDVPLVPGCLTRMEHATSLWCGAFPAPDLRRRMGGVVARADTAYTMTAMLLRGRVDYVYMVHTKTV